MTLARSDVIAGPAIITFDSQTIYTEGDIRLVPLLQLTPIQTAMFGIVGQARDTFLWELTFTPSGQWSAGHIGVLWPYTNPTRGTSVFGAADKNVVIQTLAGQQITLKAGAVTQMPELNLSASGPVIGQVTMQAVGTDDTAWSDAAKRAAVAAVAFFDTSFDPADIKVCHYDIAWGAASPWDAIETEDGVRIQFNINFPERRTDRAGILDKYIDSVDVQARFIPVGISESQWLTKMSIQGANVLRGTKLSNTDDLVISAALSGGYPNVTVYDANIVDGSLVFGTPLRTGEVVLQPIRRFTMGAAQALFAVTSSP